MCVILYFNVCIYMLVKQISKCKIMDLLGHDKDWCCMHTLIKDKLLICDFMRNFTCMGVVGILLWMLHACMVLIK